MVQNVPKIDQSRPRPIRIKHRNRELDIISSNLFLRSFNFQPSQFNDKTTNEASKIPIRLHQLINAPSISLIKHLTVMTYYLLLRLT